MTGGPHFAGNCNLFLQSPGLERTKSAILKPV